MLPLAILTLIVSAATASASAHGPPHFRSAGDVLLFVLILVGYAGWWWFGKQRKADRSDRGD